MNERPLGPLMVDVGGPSLSAEDREVLGHPLVGGVILFSRNYADPAQVTALVRDIRKLRRPPLLVAVDQEGGRVQRFREPFTRLPAAAAFGRCYDREPGRAVAAAREGGWLMAAELRAIGVDLSFAPVLDRDLGCSDVIGDRAFHAEAATITALAGAFAAGMGDAGMTATLKHFPGHGAVAADSHAELPVDERPYATIADHDLPPFAKLIRQGAQSVMMAHIRYPAVDAQPASLSRHWIKTVLRDELAFDGVVFCDDLSMNGAAAVGDYLTRAHLALEAGCDMLPVCNNRPAVIDLLDGLQVPSANTRLSALAAHGTAPDWEALKRTARHGEARRQLENLTRSSD